MSKILLMIAGAVIGIGIYLFVSSSGKISQQNKENISPTETVSTVIPSVSVKAVSDDELIKQALVKKHNFDPDDILVTVSKNNGQYASGGVREKTSEVGGGYFFAAKVGNDWKIVADGNGTISCESLKEYPNYPKDLIPECIDAITGKVVAR